MNPEEYRAALVAELAEVFSQAGLAVALIGGHAVNQWLRPRVTNDLDFTVSADRGALLRTHELLLERGFVVTREQAPNSPSGPDFVQYLRMETKDVVELQAAKTPFQEAVVERAKARYPDVPLPLATPEDLIVLKLIANRHQDWVDVDGLARLPDLDWTYIERWCGVWQITDRLDRLREMVRTTEWSP